MLGYTPGYVSSLANLLNGVVMSVMGVVEVLINYLGGLSVWWHSLNLAGVSVSLSLHNEFFSICVHLTPQSPPPKK
jgi:hypothetical protein